VNPWVESDRGLAPNEEYEMKALLVFSVAVLLVGCSQAPVLAPEAEIHGVGNIVRLDPAFDSIVLKDARIEKVGGGFQFTEGPLWRPDGHPVV